MNKKLISIGVVICILLGLIIGFGENAEKIYASLNPKYEIKPQKENNELSNLKSVIRQELSEFEFITGIHNTYDNWVIVLETSIDSEELLSGAIDLTDEVEEIKSQLIPLHEQFNLEYYPIALETKDGKLISAMTFGNKK